MTIIWTENIDAILSRGVSLESIRVNNWALTRQQALDVLDKFTALGIAVLGGDVYNIKDEVIKASYDNWYCNPLVNESKDVFIQRSLVYARNYICGYSDSEADTVRFVLVPKL